MFDKIYPQMKNNFCLVEFNNFMFNECIRVSQTSNCKRRKVGAILTLDPFSYMNFYENGFQESDYKDTIISEGSNQCLDLDDSCEKKDCLIINGHCERTIHAEVNCVLKQDLISPKNKWMYITTAPCIKCFQFLIKQKITTIYYGDDSYWKINPKYEEYIRIMASKYEIKIGKYNE